MKLTFLIPFVFLVKIIGQDTTFDLDLIKFRGMNFSADKEEIIAAFGEPEINDPEYECGFYSNDQPGGPYYQLVYDGFNYIGSDQEKFILEEVQFDKKGDVKIYYGNQVISGLTTKEEFIQIFGDYARKYFQNYPDKNGIVIFSSKNDDGGTFIFEGNRLIKFEYFSPC